MFTCMFVQFSHFGLLLSVSLVRSQSCPVVVLERVFFNAHASGLVHADWMFCARVYPSVGWASAGPSPSKTRVSLGYPN